MYSSFRQLCEKWLRIPPEPEAPPGDEASARVFHAAPKYLRYLGILWCLRTAFSLIVAAFPISFITAGLVAASNREPVAVTIALFIALAILGLIALHAAFSLAVIQLDYEKRWYLVTDRSLRIREGVKTVREITFTFANIQNLSVTQGPIQRMLGIADLKVETAGGGNVAGSKQAQPGLSLHTAYFRGIDNAEEVKQLISARMRGHRDAGLGDHGDHAPIPLRAIAGPSTLAALQAVLAEAKALRQAAEGGLPPGG